MSSFKNAAKSYQKTHRERAQPAARQHLGLLEKKKDYKRRAEDFHKKQNTKKLLMQKALDRNPDEFYFKMVKTKMEDGEHQCEETVPKYTEDQLILMQSQDIKYINYKRSLELQKIERLKASLHLLDATDKPKNRHTIFVDSKNEVLKFDAAKRLKTHPSLLNRTYNRPRLETLSTQSVAGQLTDTALAECALERNRLYSLLSSRIERERQLHIAAQKMEMKKLLADKRARRKKIADETVTSAAVYKWMPERKR